MLSRILSALRTPPLPNTGSLARDLLASERTFLAWLRTGLGFIALGVALEKVEALAALSPPALLQLENSRTKLAAGVLVASGSACVAHGTRRYFDTLQLLRQGLFRPNVAGVAVAAVTSVGIAVAGSLMVVENENENENENEARKGKERGKVEARVGDEVR